jgi:hypothetical protein
MRRCAVCLVACRPNTRRKVWAISERGRLVPRRVCVSCYRGAVPLLMHQPQPDPRLCIECKRAPAKLCEGCNLRSRTNAVREAKREHDHGTNPIRANPEPGEDA